jgi:hypothetical protein
MQRFTFAFKDVEITNGLSNYPNLHSVTISPSLKVLFCSLTSEPIIISVWNLLSTKHIYIQKFHTCILRCKHYAFFVVITEMHFIIQLVTETTCVRKYSHPIVELCLCYMNIMKHFFLFFSTLALLCFQNTDCSSQSDFTLITILLQIPKLVFL